MAERSSITVAIMTPGDMGHAIGRVLQSSIKHSIRVITNLTGRSTRTQQLSHSAGIIDVQTDEELVAQADFLLSIIVPSQATALAQRFTNLVQSKKNLIYVDMNAIAPQTVQSISELFPKEQFVDGCIIGLPPNSLEDKTAVYLSGSSASMVADLFVGLNLIRTNVIGDAIGQASVLKMCFASISKGLTAINIQASITAKCYGLDQVLFNEMQENLPDIYQRLSRSIPRIPPKAGRWVGEMEEISKTHQSIGLSEKTFLGAAETYRFVAEQTPLGKEILEDRKHGTTLDEALEIMFQSLKESTTSNSEK